MIQFKIFQRHPAQGPVLDSLQGGRLIEKRDAEIFFEKLQNDMHAANLRDMGEIGEADIFHVQMFLKDIPGPGTRLPQQQMFIEQIPDPAGFIREAVACRADRNERLGAVNVGVKFGRIVIAFHQGKMDIACAETF